MLRANQAVRLGLRAASRNPELAFGKALLDQTGNLLALLPVVFAVVLLVAASGGDPLAGLSLLVRAGAGLAFPVIGASVTALVLTFVAGMLFWAGALPLLAADAEMGARPPPGNFPLLAVRGFPRVLATGALVTALSTLFALATTAALVFALPVLAVRPTPLVLAGAALVLAVTIAFGLLVDLLGRLWLVRAAALGDSVSAAFGRAASLLSSRLGACVTVATAFFVLELIVGAAAATVTGALSRTGFFDPSGQLLALAPRIAVGLATAAIFAWLEVGRQGALAALAADADGLIELPPDEPVRAQVPTVLARPERVVEAEPVPEPVPEPVIDALPVPEAEPVVEALPVSDDDDEKR